MINLWKREIAPNIRVNKDFKITIIIKLNKIEKDIQNGQKKLQRIIIINKTMKQTLYTWKIQYLKLKFDWLSKTEDRVVNSKIDQQNISEAWTKKKWKKLKKIIKRYVWDVVKTSSMHAIGWTEWAEVIFEVVMIENFLKMIVPIPFTPYTKIN